jgi:two-component system chemotaxis response regulator CheB
VPKRRPEEAGAAEAMFPRRRPTQKLAAERIVAIGASTGGTEAIKEVLTRLPKDMPPVVIVQHIPKAFSGAFAARMDAVCDITVCEASDGQPVLPGHAYIAPGDMHLLVAPGTSHYQCRLSGADPVNRHRPSVDVLFRSVAQAAGRNGVGVILTGMGRDGAAGLKEMLAAGAATIAQDEASSVVWGMPGAAWEIGAVQSLHPLTQIAEKIIALVSTVLHRDIQSA